MQMRKKKYAHNNGAVRHVSLYWIHASEQDIFLDFNANTLKKLIRQYKYDGIVLFYFTDYKFAHVSSAIQFDGNMKSFAKL